MKHRVKINCAVTLAAVLMAQAAVGQQAYPLPFASVGNSIELTVANNSLIPLSAVKVEAKNVPSWIRFVSSEQLLKKVDTNGVAQALFSFAVDQSAPANERYSLLFTITTQTGESWSKEITISVNPPDRFELFQNYPNPFNPSTAISYQLSADSKVSLRIYALLGREVATLVDQDKPAGFHQETWNAAPYSSGMYIYQLTYTDQQGNRQFHRKTMLLVK